MPLQPNPSISLWALLTSSTIIPRASHVIKAEYNTPIEDKGVAIAT